MKLETINPWIGSSVNSSLMKLGKSGVNARASKANLKQPMSFNELVLILDSRLYNLKHFIHTKVN
jgi:hypothetical protein